MSRQKERELFYSGPEPKLNKWFFFILIHFILKNYYGIFLDVFKWEIDIEIRAKIELKIHMIVGSLWICE